LYTPWGLVAVPAESGHEEDFRKTIDEKTKGVCIESTGNPRLNVPDIAEIVKVAHEAGIPLIVDNTFGIGGFLIRPIDHGADVALPSASDRASSRLSPATFAHHRSAYLFSMVVVM